MSNLVQYSYLSELPLAERYTVPFEGISGDRFLRDGVQLTGAVPLYKWLKINVDPYEEGLATVGTLPGVGTSGLLPLDEEMRYDWHDGGWRLNEDSARSWRAATFIRLGLIVPEIAETP